MTEDIRWKQRFDNYGKAFHELKENLALANDRPLSKLEKQGVIQGFEYTHELAWNLLKDYLEFQGHVGLIGSRDTTREAFKRGLMGDGEVWMEMIKSRNLTSHAYDRDTAEQIYTAIVTRYFTEFQLLHTEFSRRNAQEN
jgi:nucleotidyltransferase substrate binding protein (TIGR01987 family)